MALAVKLDKSQYAPGETMTATITSAPTDRTSQSNVTFSSGPLASASAAVVVTVPLTYVDDSGRTWTKKSDDGSTAVYTAPA